ncbi:MAG: adenosylcobinamide-phosphate synthase CbiB [Gloeobacterales cyanobacterium]
MVNPWIFLAAWVLDRILGDPVRWVHPVQVMGWLISRWRDWSFRYFKDAPFLLKLSGVVLTLLLTLGSAAVVWSVILGAGWIHPLFGWGTEVVILASGLAGRSLQDAAWAVLKPLKTGNLSQARETLAIYVGRDTEHLDSSEVLRAVVETVAENTTDGILAPLFWAVIGGAPLLMAFKAASTLDSMIGYRRGLYESFGWAGARLDDVLNWVPARLMALSVGVLSGKLGTVMRIVRRDAAQDPSPNAGVSIAAFAAALGVRLGGENSYHGEKKIKPFLGDALYPLTQETSEQTLRLLDRLQILWVIIGLVLLEWLW